MLSQDAGSGIHHDEVAGTWTSTLPGFGYLDLADSGEIRVVPAVKISAERLRADLQLRPAHSGDAPLTRADVDEAIRSTGIVYGLLPERIDAAWKAYERRERAVISTCIAEGTPPGPGWDSGIELTIDCEEASTATDEEQIDYRDLGLVSNVKKGQQIGIWKPADFGKPGTGVDGSTLQADQGRVRQFEELKNVIATEGEEEGVLLLTAEIDGMLQVQSHTRLRIVNLLEFEDNIDFETGNIEANGSVRVGGSIRPDFKVSLQGDLTVKGNIEEAVVRAGGKVLAEQGIFGGKNGSVRAGGRIFVQFGQNARLIGAGDIVVGDSDTRSTMECAGRLLAKDGRGHLLGGHYAAGKEIMARELGSPLGVPTHVAVGRIPLTARHLRAELEAEGLDFGEEDLTYRPARITVFGAVHPGVEVEIRGSRLVVETVAHNVMFEYDVKARAVKMTPRK